MPRDLQGRHWAHGNFHSRVVTRMSTANYPRARGTTRFSPTPYPSADSIIARMDADDDYWYHDTGADLHPRDFIFQARIQTARRLSQRAVRFPSRDLVLERLLEEGTFDREAPELRSHSEEYAMAHSSAMVNRLLMRIETLESQVCNLFVFLSFPLVNSCCPRYARLERGSKPWNCRWRLPTTGSILSAWGTWMR